MSPSVPQCCVSRSKLKTPNEGVQGTWTQAKTGKPNTGCKRTRREYEKDAMSVTINARRQP